MYKRQVLLGQGEVAYSPLQMGDYNDDSIEKFEYNPEKAKELIEADGWVLGEDGIYEKDGEKLSFTIHNGQDDQVRIDMSNICAQQLQMCIRDSPHLLRQPAPAAQQRRLRCGYGGGLGQQTAALDFAGGSDGAGAFVVLCLYDSQ